METKQICPNCRKPLPPDVPLGLCPECLIKSGFSTGTEPGLGNASDFVPPAVAEIAALFPQFEILGLIGKGGMGAVYQARQPALDRCVALKILPPKAADDAGFAERFNREARALARVSHPNIVAVHDFGKAGALHFLVMEFVDGANLREIERAGRLAPEQALQIVPQICDALQFAHNEGIVHRDIKPENILLDKKGRVKITDFGIAKIVGAAPEKIGLTGARDIVGTLHYMAPEQVEKPNQVDHRADIFSLGVVFYELLTGELPLGKFAPPSHMVQVDVRLDDVVLRALEKEPERRYQQASEVKTDVQAISGTPPLHASNVPPVIRPTISNPRRGGGRVWIIVAAAVAAMIFLMVLVPAAVFAYLKASRRAELSRRSSSQMAPFSREQPRVQTPSAAAQNENVSPPSNATNFTAEKNRPTFPVNLPALRYQWKSGAGYAYSVAVEATADDYIETISGNVNYNVRSVDGDKATLTYMSHLGLPLRLPKPGRTLPISFPRGFANFWADNAHDFSSHEIAVDSSGRILSQSGRNSALPQALGDVERLMFEPLSPNGASAWEANSDCAVTLSKFVPVTPRSSFGHEQETVLSAHEHATYQVASTSGSTVQIKKRYDLKTQETFGGQPRVQLTGEGTITFDTALGQPRTMEFQGTVSEASETITRRTPLKLSYKLLNGTEKETALRPPAKVEAKELTASEVGQLLRDLNSANVGRRSAAISRLAGAKPGEPRNEVVGGLIGALNDPDWATRQSAVRALGVWGTAAAVQPLIGRLGDSEFSVRWAAISALAELKSQQAIEPLARQLANRTDSMQAAQALQAFGPAAEDAVIELLKVGENHTRREACRVLKEIGTHKSVPALTAAASDADAIVAMLAKAALKAVDDRPSSPTKP